MTSNVVLSNVEYNVVGKRPIRHDGVDKVTGKPNTGQTFSSLAGSTERCCAAPMPTLTSGP